MKIKVYGYDLNDKTFGVRSPGSLKLDLRGACKLSPLYFKGVPKFTKNLGCLLFGQPNKWKGLFFMEIIKEDEKSTSADLIISFDHRKSLFPSEVIEDLRELIKQGLDALQKEGIIKSYEEVDR